MGSGRKDDRTRKSGRGRSSEQSRRNFEGSRKFQSVRRRDSRPEMHKVKCSECGKDCEVPFKPQTSKPLFCDVCFKKEKPSAQFDIINEKLDKIMDALHIK